MVDILDSVDIPDPNDNSKKERWYRVRGHDEEKIEGWIEARNIMPDKVLENARKLAEDGLHGRAGRAVRLDENDDSVRQAHSDESTLLP